MDIVDVFFPLSQFTVQTLKYVEIPHLDVLSKNEISHSFIFFFTLASTANSSNLHRTADN